MPSPQKGEVWESPSGLSFKVTRLTNKIVEVEVQRLYRGKDKELTARTITREVPHEVWPYFSSAYKQVEVKK